MLHVPKQGDGFLTPKPPGYDCSLANDFFCEIVNLMSGMKFIPRFVFKIVSSISGIVCPPSQVRTSSNHLVSTPRGSGPVVASASHGFARGDDQAQRAGVNA